MISPSFNQGIKTLDSGLIDPSKNGQSQDDRGSATAPRSQGGSQRDSHKPPHLLKFNFQAM
jgi:hypothetical protein